MFRKKRFFERKAVSYVLGAINDTGEQFIELKKALDEKASAERNVIDECQNRFFEIAKEEPFNKEKAFDLINTLLKFCRNSTVDWRRDCDFFFEEGGSCMAIQSILIELSQEDKKKFWQRRKGE